MDKYYERDLLGAISVSRIHGITSSGGLCKGEKMETCWFYFGFLLASPGARLVGGGAVCGSHVDCGSAAFLNIFTREMVVSVLTRALDYRLLQIKSFYQIPQLQSKPRREPPLYLWNSSTRYCFNQMS